ncbi:hypothetical protein [Desulfopila sp. IMCC35008]|uniref:hypothetical protein n=1 Tax=Desulfopila sp. IMCC35008 TaxID=2653858 RepID=UPI0013CFE799|nr:hypothetical protein [Desulfopila sp. IMCC35008]
MQTPQGTPSLRPPGKRPDDSGSSGSAERISRTVMVVMSAALFGVLAILVYGVLVYVPKLEGQVGAGEMQHEESLAAGTVSAPPVKRESATADTEDGSHDQHEMSSREILKKLLALNSRLASDNIQVWGQGSYSSIVALIGEGDGHLRKSEFRDAEERYVKAYEKLQQLDADRNEILVSAVQAGMAALEQGDSVEAQKHFSMALAVDAADQEAKDGLQRTQNLETVRTSLARGKEFEEQGELEAALLEYRKGYELDGTFQPLAIAYERLTEQVKEQKVRDHLSHFYLYLDSSDIPGAEASLADALRLSPTDPAVLAAKKKLESAREDLVVLRLRQQAQSQMSNEQWHKALTSYQQVLKIAPQAAFALQGVAVARRNSELVVQIDTLLKSAERLQDERVQQNGRATLEYARRLEGLGPRTTAKINDLDEVLTRASQPIVLILQSDNLTEVTLYHVGRLGRFYQRRLVLRPGKYTIIGERTGYRVKRSIIELTHEQPEVEYSIRCEEVF